MFVHNEASCKGFDEKDSSNSKANFKFAEGTFKSITGAIGKVAPEKFKLETKSASIGIRGTIVVGNQEKVACTQGRITVTSAGVTQVLGAGMMTNTETGKAPTPPTKIEGSLLKEVEIDSGTKKEESKSTTSATKEKTSEEETSDTTTQDNKKTNTENNSTTTVQNNVATTNIVNTSFTEVSNNVNNTTSDTATSLALAAEEARKKAQAIDAASTLASQASTIAQSVVLASTNTSSASTSASSIAQGSTDSQITTAVTNAVIASTSASTLSSQTQTLKTEIETLLTQAQSASAGEAVTIYGQIKTKSDLLNKNLTDVTSLVATAQNSLKTVSVNLSSTLASQASTIAQSVALASSTTQTTANSITQTIENASTSALSEVSISSNTLNQATTNANSLSVEAQALKDDIATLLTQAQSASTSDAVIIYGQIKTKSDLLNKKLSDITIIETNAATIAQNISNAIVNIPFYSASLSVLNSNGGMGSKVFNVPSGGSTITMATYGPSDGIWNGGNNTGFDPVLILLKWNNSTSKYEYVSNSKSDDGWVVAGNFYNSILNITLGEGKYKVVVADYPFSTEEALKSVNRGTSDEGNVKIYFTSTSNLTFDSTDSVAIEKYSYITRMNNKTYIKNSTNQTASIENDNAKFAILADSNVGTAIKVDNYGYFVTISDSFDNSKNVFLNTSEIDDESSWGYWTQTLKTTASSIDMKSTWLSGNQITPAADYKSTFQGQVIGGVTSGEGSSGYIKLDSDNIFKATIDIGAAKITDSKIQFKDSLSNSWSGTFDTSGVANVNQQGFNSSITGTGTTGSLSGKYYGITNSNNTTTVKSIGGEFNMTKGTANANGLFKAREIPIVVPLAQTTGQ